MARVTVAQKLSLTAGVSPFTVTVEMTDERVSQVDMDIHQVGKENIHLDSLAEGDLNTLEDTLKALREQIAAIRKAQQTGSVQRDFDAARLVGG